MKLKHEIRKSIRGLFVDGDINDSWGTSEKSEELVQLFKKWALGLLPEDAIPFDDPKWTQGANDTLSYIRNKINRVSKN